MGARGMWMLLWWACAATGVGCGAGEADEGAAPALGPSGEAAVEEVRPAPVPSTAELVPARPPLEAAPVLVLRGAEVERPTPPVATFQPAFHQALRGHHEVSTLTTFRLR